MNIICIMSLDTKEIHITFCDDWMELMDVDKLDNSKTIHIRGTLYYTSAVITIGILLWLSYWTYCITIDVNNMEEK